MNGNVSRFGLCTSCQQSTHDVEIITTLECEHSFHEKCIANQVSCPVCSKPKHRNLLDLFNQLAGKNPIEVAPLIQNFDNVSIKTTNAFSTFTDEAFKLMRASHTWEQPIKKELKPTFQEGQHQQQQPSQITTRAQKYIKEDRDRRRNAKLSSKRVVGSHPRNGIVEEKGPNDQEKLIEDKKQESQNIAADFQRDGADITKSSAKPYKSEKQQKCVRGPTPYYSITCLTFKNCCHGQCGLNKVTTGRDEGFKNCWAFSGANCNKCSQSCYKFHDSFPKKRVKKEALIQKADPDAKKKANPDAKKKAKIKDLHKTKQTKLTSYYKIKEKKENLLDGVRRP